MRDYYTKFKHIQFCSECDWIRKPTGRPSVWLAVCPECGEHTMSKVGRFHMRETPRYLYSNKHECIDVLFKEDDKL